MNISPSRQKPGVMLYNEILNAILDSGLKPEQIASMLCAIRNYSQYGELPDFHSDAALNAIWFLAKPSIDRDNARYDKMCTQREEAINKRWFKAYAEKNGLDPNDNEARQLWLYQRNG